MLVAPSSSSSSMCRVYLWLCVCCTASGALAYPAVSRLCCGRAIRLLRLQAFHSRESLYKSEHVLLSAAPLSGAHMLAA